MLLSIVILSHERPEMLARAINSLGIFQDQSQAEVIVCDNSKAHYHAVRRLEHDFPWIRFVFKPGGTLIDNFQSALRTVNGNHFSIFHDDDFVSFHQKDVEKLLEILDSQDSIEKLFVFNSYGISCDYDYFCKANTSIRSPSSAYCIPYTLPFFPAWVYPRSNRVLELLKSAMVDKHPPFEKYGKYFDIILIEKLLEMYEYSFSVLPGSYFHVEHPQSDGLTLSIDSKVNLVLHVLRVSSPVQNLRFILYWLANIPKKVVLRLL